MSEKAKAIANLVVDAVLVLNILLQVPLDPIPKLMTYRLFLLLVVNLKRLKLLP